MMKRSLFAAGFAAVLAGAAWAQPAGVVWQHFSTTKGDLEAPNSGKQQTSATVFDIDGDGVNDFVITERTMAPAVVWYKRHPKGWTKHVMHAERINIEAGATYFDVDGDGDLDFVAAGDYKSNEVAWWENPHPRHDPSVPWKRHVIKNTGVPKHHDLIFGDFDGDGKAELVFWNQNARALYMARIPADPRNSGPWPFAEIYAYSRDSEQEQRGNADGFKGVNEHEGLAKADIDGDGKLDIIGGGRWFKHIEGDRFQENLVDAGYQFSRAAAGQFIEGGRPEILFVVGDGAGPLVLYEWVKGRWVSKVLLEQVTNGHSLDVVDFNGDGKLDIFLAEMRLNGGNPESKIYILLGDGKGNFKTETVATGYGNHESKMADLDGNGTLDILGKPYNWETPRLDIWLNMGAKR
jgi:hypothetical protein